MTRPALAAGMTVTLRGDSRTWTIDRQHASGVTWHVTTAAPEPDGWPGAEPPSWFCNYGTRWGRGEALILPREIDAIHPPPRKEGTDAEPRPEVPHHADPGPGTDPA